MPSLAAIRKKRGAGRRATMKDLADQLGLSISTVSRGLGEFPTISEETRAKIRKAAREMNYIRNNMARGLAVRSSRLIGLFLSDISNPFFSEVTRGAHDVAYQNSYVLALCNTERNIEKEAAFSKTLLESQADGMIFAGGALGTEHLKILKEHRVPFVMAGRRSSLTHVPSVTVSNFSIGYQGAQHVIGLGHKKIMFLSGPSDSATGRDRQQGYEDAMRAGGLTPWVMPGDFKVESGFAFVSEFLKMKKRPTAVFAANDMMALGVLLGAGGAGVRVPEDLSVIGCDDIPLARLIRPALTTIRVPMYEIGARAMGILLGILEGQRQRASQAGAAPSVLLECELVLRESAAAP